jgi:hypothetical protein
VSNEVSPIDDDEILYRRVPVSTDWYAGGVLQGEAFSPRKDEASGISVFRAKFKSVEEVAKGQSAKGYYVVSLLAAELRANAIDVEPSPEVPSGWDESHAELPQLNAANRKSSEVLMLKERLAQLGTRIPVQGPFKPESPA